MKVKLPLPEKRWFRIEELAQRWAISSRDIEDYALDDILQLSVFVVNIAAEAGSLEHHGDRVLSILEDLPTLNGPQPLGRSDLLEIFNDGQAQVRAFRTATPHTYLHVAAGRPTIVVRRENLIVIREERDRFERAHSESASAVSNSSMLWHTDDFIRVRLGSDWHSFGSKQAKVLRLLKVASESDNPWCDGKWLLDEAGATTLRLVDLFKRKPAWRQMVVADGRGRYRFNVDLFASGGSRIRFFRRQLTSVSARRLRATSVSLSYCNTSSARVSKDSGSFRPSTSAVLRFPAG